MGITLAIILYAVNLGISIGILITFMAFLDYFIHQNKK